MENLSRRTFLAFTAGAFITPPIWPAEARVAGFPALLDHILLGCNDLDRGIAFVEERAGVRASFGGVHPGRGTQNALISLGERTPREPNPRRYLEIIAQDPKQSGVQQYSAITKLNEPRLIGWAAHRDDLDEFAKHLDEQGVAFEGPQSGLRQRPDGKVLRWRALRLKDDHGGLLPFFIEWSKDSVHPSVDAPKGCRLTRFEAASPEAEDLLRAISRVQLDLHVRTAMKPALQATVAGPKGQFLVTS